MTDEIMAAIHEHDLASLRRHVEGGVDLEVRSQATASSHGVEGWTALTLAAYYGNREAIEYLLAQGADLDAPTGSAGGMWEWSPLMVAAFRSHHETVRLLLERGADVFAENQRAETALSLADGNGHIEIMQMLVGAGALDCTPK